MRKPYFSSTHEFLLKAGINPNELIWHDEPISIKERIACVYFLKARNGYVKIGETVDLLRRLGEHKQVWHGELEFSLLGFIECINHYHLEDRLHLEFGHNRKRHRKRGDWFALTAEDIQFIKSLGGVK